MRIDFADVDPMFEGRTTQMGQVDGVDMSQARDRGGPRGPPPRGIGRPMPPPPMERQLPPNLPKGQPLPPGVGATDAISKTLATIPPNQLLDIMSQMKSLVTSSPEQARTLLNAHPQLAYALFQAMLMMNVVDATILQRILTTSGALGPDPTLTAPPPAQPEFSGALPPLGRGPAPYSGPPPMMHQQQQQMPPQPIAPPQQPQSNVSHLPEEQKALLAQVLQLTPEQISALPADQQEGIRQLKASLGQA